MIIATWNCRGASAKSFPRLLKEIVMKYKIRIMVLLKTRVSGVKADRIMGKIGFSNWLRVEATGFAGGIWVLWNNWDVCVEYLCSNTQLVHCKVTDLVSGGEACATFVYGEPRVGMGSELWSALKTIAQHVKGKWLVMGDFNAFLSQTDKEGGSLPINVSMTQFNDCVQECGLLQLPVQGSKFTWEKD